MYQPYPGSDTQLPQTQRPPAPASVRTAVNAMYAGAATSLLGIAMDILTISDTKSAIARHSRNMTASQVASTQHVLIAGFIAGGVIAAVVWFVLARACQRGRNWARITGTVLFALATVDTFIGLATPIAGVVRIWAVVVWLAGLTAIIFLWRRDSSAYFRPRPA
jgi:hypothetical protein